LKTHDHYEILKLILEETIDLKFKNFIIEDMYGNTLPEIKEGPFSHKLHENLHSFNKHGFRSPDFKSDTDYLFSGCSITSGIGLPIEKIWPEILAKSLGSSYANIATSGDSISSQVYKIFKYINEFGNPKNIIALFPDFNRFLIFNNRDLLSSKKFQNEDSSDKTMRDLYLENISPFENQKNAKYFKRPLEAEDVITSEIANIYSARNIHILSQYCKSNGINFAWSTWDLSTERLINKVGNSYKEFISMETQKWNYDLELMKDVYLEDCHNDQKNDGFFHNASDLEHGLEYAHFGSHRHMHYADKFMEKIKSWGNNEG
jgi:hypothetical protein